MELQKLLLSLVLFIFFASVSYAYDIFKYVHAEHPWNVSRKDNFILPLKIVINNPNSYILTDYQVKINLTKYINTTILKVCSDKDCTQILNFCYEQPNGECNTTPSTVIWVKIPEIPANSSKVIYIFESDTNYAMAKEDVFNLYDNFDDGTINTNKWDPTGAFGYTIDESDGLIKLYGQKLENGDIIGGDSVGQTGKADLISRDYSTYFFFRINYTNASANDPWKIFLINEDGNEFQILGSNMGDPYVYSSNITITVVDDKAYVYNSSSLIRAIEVTGKRFRIKFEANSIYGDGYVAKLFLDWIYIKKNAEKEPILLLYPLNYAIKLNSVDIALENNRILSTNGSFLLDFSSTSSCNLIISVNDQTIYNNSYLAGQTVELQLKYPTKINITCGNHTTTINNFMSQWVVIDFSEIANHIPLQADLSNVRVECENCSYYRDYFLEKKIYINNSAVFYITSETNNTYPTNTVPPGQGTMIVLENLPDIWYSYDTTGDGSYGYKDVGWSYPWHEYLQTNDDTHDTAGTGNYELWAVGDGIVWSKVIYEPEVGNQNLNDGECIQIYIRYGQVRGILNSGSGWKIGCYKYDYAGSYGSSVVTKETYDDYFYVCRFGNKIYVYKNTTELCSDTPSAKTFFLEVYTVGGSTDAGIWLEIGPDGSNTGAKRVIFLRDFNTSKTINLTFSDLQQVNPYYLCVDYDFPTPDNATSKAKYSFKFLNVTNNTQILKDLNLTEITSINVVFKDYSDATTLQTNTTLFGQKTFITFNNTNYPLIQRAWDFSDISWCWKPKDFDANHYIRVPTTDEARLLKIYVQPPEAGYWIYLYKDTSPKGMIDIRSTDPNGGVYFYVPESDWWILKIYDQYGNLTYSYEGELPDTTYNIYISLGGMISSTELTPEEISRISKYPIELEDPMVFEFDESVGGKVTKVEWYYFIGNVLYEKSYNYSPYTTEVTIDLSDELNASKIWFIFTFEDGKTWVIQYLNETYKAVSEGIEEVRSAFQDLELQFLAIIVFLSVYLLVLIYSPSEYLHIASAIGGIIFLAFIGVLNNLYIVGGLNIIIFLAGIGMVRYNV